MAQEALPHGERRTVLTVMSGEDLKEWEGPFEIYHKEEGSPFVCCYLGPGML